MLPTHKKVLISPVNEIPSLMNIGLCDRLTKISGVGVCVCVCVWGGGLRVTLPLKYVRISVCIFIRMSFLMLYQPSSV